MEYTIAETKYGKLRGELQNGVHTFKGVPYAAPPLGKLRFHPPVEPECWEGVRDALRYGNRAIQGAVPFAPFPAEYKRFTKDFGTIQVGNKFSKEEESPTSEDCLYLNIWTPALNDGKKRAVMVWCHGGGFTQGSGEGYWRDGTNLAAQDDVVVVSFNHRLNVFGYMYLADCEDKTYADCSNVGLLDMVQVLKFVHENIENFGGDPGNVLVFGESGGGQKVSALTNMPAAKGLVHKGISMSAGYFTLAPEPTMSASRDILAELGVSTSDLSPLADMPMEQIYEAYSKIVDQRKEGADFGWELGPIVDGVTVPCSPFDDGFGKTNPEVSFMSGTTKDDGRLEGAMDGPLFDVNSYPLLRAKLIELHVPEEIVDQTIADYRSELPEGATYADILFTYLTDLRFRQAAIRQAEIRVEQGCAPTYMYIFSWEAPYDNFRAVHGVEIPFFFRNLKYAPNLIPMPDNGYLHLQDLTATAMTNFAKTGKPFAEGLPEWPEFELERRATMDLGVPCEVVDDPRQKGRLLMDKVDYTR